MRAGTYGETGIAAVDALPASYYTETSVFETEKRIIFDKAWQCLGHIGMAKKVGDYFTGKIIDQDILIVRGEDEELRAFYNVCQHRGHILAQGSGSCRRLICPYHAWAYGLDGSLKTAPNAKNIPGFRPSEFHLQRVRLEVFCGMVFVSLDAHARPLQEEFGFLERGIRLRIPEIERQRLVYEHPLTHHCNWKASVENFSECYHCAPVHSYLTANVIDSDSYQLTVQGRSQQHFIKGRDAALEQHLWFLWPNTAFGLYPIPDFGMTFCIRNMYPVAIHETIYNYRWFVTDGLSEEKVVAYAKHHATTTGAEDAAVAGGVQRGMNSQGFRQGILLADPSHSATSEHAIAAFHRWVTDSLK
jgi:phenylpropionate dioxygenase-like ring-hydroxylating dioxygenase large terminal subunit